MHRAGRRFGIGQSFDRSTANIINSWIEEDQRDYWRDFINGVITGIERNNNVNIDRVY